MVGGIEGGENVRSFIGRGSTVLSANTQRSSFFSHHVPLSVTYEVCCIHTTHHGSLLSDFDGKEITRGGKEFLLLDRQTLKNAQASTV